MAVINGIEFSNEQVDKLAEMGALNIARKNDPASTSLSATPALHGPLQGGAGYGTFSKFGSRPQMYSAFPRPYTIAALVSVEKSEYTEELLEIMTGVTDGGGTNSSGFCDDTAPIPGAAKGARQLITFGDWKEKTNLNAVPLLGQLRNRADIPREILNQPPEANPMIPQTMWEFPRDQRDQLQYELFLLGVDLERSLEVVMVRGDKTLTGSNRRRGWIREFTGLTSMIKTGYTDYDTGITAPALDSAVITYNASISSTASDGSGRNFMECLADLFFGIQQRASVTGFEGIRWAFVGRMDLHRAIAYVVACQYFINRCSFAGSTDGNRQDVTNTKQLFDEMVNGQYILIDGVKVPFMYSEGMLREVVANATYKSDLLLVPFDWNGTPLVKLEYFDMGNPYATKYASYTGPDTTVMNNGLYIVGKAKTSLCMEYHFASRMRMILETPFLAGRIDSIQYAFRAPIRDALPGTSFYANGGISIVPS